MASRKLIPEESRLGNKVVRLNKCGSAGIQEVKRERAVKEGVGEILQEGSGQETRLSG